MNKRPDFYASQALNNPLDDSAVHPERYDLVSRMVSSINMSVEQVIGNEEAVRLISPQEFIGPDVGLYTLEDILEELKKPGRDPRDEFHYAEFDEEIKDIADLEARHAS